MILTIPRKMIDAMVKDGSKNLALLDMQENACLLWDYLKKRHYSKL